MMAKNHWIEIDGLQVHYLSGGEGPSTLVLIHGGGTDSASLSWGSGIDVLSSACRVITPDLPGFGRTGQPEVDCTVDYYTRFLKRFTEELNLGSFDLGGLSMGGQISLNFTLQFPALIKKLVLLGSAGLGTKLRWQVLGWLGGQFPGLQKMLRNRAVGSPEAIRLSLRLFLHNQELITDDLVDEVSRGISVPGAGRAWRSYLAHEMDYSGFRHGFLGRLGEISVPTLILHGANDKLISVKWAEKAHQLLPNSKLCILPECGHWLPREKTAEFTRQVLEFIAE
jgi:pimeloyl-ACP methyl ester carboxylesterase